MKLKIGSVVSKKEEEKEVVLSLKQAGEDIELVVQKEGKPSQVVLIFYGDGSIKRIQTYYDIGFNVESSGKVIIS